MSLHQQTAVIATEAGGVMTEIIVTALSDEHVAAATALMANLVGHTRSMAALESNTEPVIGFKAGRQTAVGVL